MKEAVQGFPLQIDPVRVLESAAQFLGEVSSSHQIIIYLNPDFKASTYQKTYPIEWVLDKKDLPNVLKHTELLRILSDMRRENNFGTSLIKSEDLSVVFGWGFSEEIPLLGFALVREREFSKNEISYYRAVFSRISYFYQQCLKVLEQFDDYSNIIDSQARTIDVLYGVTNAVTKGAEPEDLAREGIEALCRASGALAGICYLYKVKDFEEKSPSVSSKSAFELKPIASYGLSNEVWDKYNSRPCPQLFSLVAQSHDPVIIPKVSYSENNWWMIPEISGSCIALPIKVSSGENLGVLILLHSEEKSIDPPQVALASAAASHIGIAARQSVLVVESQKHAKSISALYRLSHELSSFLTLEDLFQRAFEIMKEELDIDRYWLGLLNETGSRLVGQAAFGSGWKRKLIEINVEVTGIDNPLRQIIHNKKPIILNTKSGALAGIGLTRFIVRNKIDSVGLVPIIAGGQVLGILAFEAIKEGKNLSGDDLSLLSSFGAEIGNVLLTKRLEERLAAGETMRAAGLLSAGIAHNFNNVLQGILGQASLLEMYSEKPEMIKKSATIITEAATKGATLVKQLLSFSNLDDPAPELIDAQLFVTQNKKKFQRLLKDRQYIRYEVEDSPIRAFADPRHVLRIIQVLLINASEAMDSNGCVEILIDEIVVDLNTPHFEVPYGKYIRIGVRDNGKGMDAETRRRCFEPFFTTKNVDPASGLSLKGEGMGLAAAYALAKRNGGRLVVDSIEGKGSLFTLYLKVDPKHQIEEYSGEEQEKESILSRIEIEKESSAAPLLQKISARNKEA